MTQAEVNKLSQVQRAKLMRQLIKAGGDVTLTTHYGIPVRYPPLKHTHVVVNCGQTATYIDLHDKAMHP